MANEENLKATIVKIVEDIHANEPLVTQSVLNYTKELIQSSLCEGKFKATELKKSLQEFVDKMKDK